MIESTELIPQISEKKLTPEQVSELTYYLKNRFVQMKAGCIANQLQSGTRYHQTQKFYLQSLGFPWTLVKKYTIKDLLPLQSFLLKRRYFYLVEAKNILHKGVSAWRRWTYPPIFLTPKSDGSFIMTLNLKKLNDHIPYIHFKMETIKSLLNLVTRNCYMAKFAIKDAYYSFPILPEHQKFLKSSLRA